jgi:hypothetical protein
MARKKFVEKTIKNHLRSNNYEVCTAVARRIPNVLDVMVMVLENIEMAEASKSIMATITLV